MNKIILLTLIFIFILLFTAGCVGDSSDTIKYDTLAELKEEIGDALLYPNALPFEPAKSFLYGYYYKRTKTWDYNVRFENVDFMKYDYEAYRQLEENSPVAAYVWIETHEPKHRDSVIRTPRQIAAEKHDRLIAEAGDAVLEINGVTVPHGIEFKSEAVGYNMNAGVTYECPAYVHADVFAVFIHNGIIYTVNIEVYGHENETEETMWETGEDMLKLIVMGMIISGVTP